MSMASWVAQRPRFAYRAHQLGAATLGLMALSLIGWALLYTPPPLRWAALTMALVCIAGALTVGTAQHWRRLATRQEVLGCDALLWGTQAVALIAWGMQ